MLVIFAFVFGFLASVTTAIDLSGCLPNRPKIINTLLTLHGDVYSPGYLEGQEYPEDLFCEYTLKAPTGFRIKLTFVDFDLDATDLCQSDSLAIFDGDSRVNPVHGIFCGNNSYPNIVSVKGPLHMIFKTDFFRGGRGFHLKYETSGLISPCPFGYQPCRNRKCYDVNNICNGKDECGDGTDEENCGFPVPTTTCGLRPSSLSTIFDESPDRIVGGKEATPFSWPWQADLQLSFFHPNGHMCGGTLINAQWVLSAAHCFMQNKHPLEWRVHLGNHHKFKNDTYEQVRHVIRIIVFPEITGDPLLQWQLTDLTHDIALMKLNAPVKFNDHVRPACLPNQGYKLQVDTKCMATGWGMTRGTGFSHLLKEVDLTIEHPIKCLGDNGPVNEQTMVCVKNRDGYQDVCHGDSGGPLVCEINGKWNVMGATSHGTRGNFIGGLCALPNSYTVYSRVADKIQWIQKMINKY